jgi:hypothetical protein
VLRFNAEGREELVSQAIEVRRGKVNRAQRFVMKEAAAEITEVSAVSPDSTEGSDSANAEATTNEAAQAAANAARSEEEATE